mmetsp:Transcript_164934/g.529407  ORF Transcript_164934/g.529407 Transcript_164934/m.529407 type:complete len:213 (+) Transcript_164934:1428-2066(+)
MRPSSSSSSSDCMLCMLRPVSSRFSRRMPKRMWLIRSWLVRSCWPCSLSPTRRNFRCCREGSLLSRSMCISKFGAREAPQPGMPDEAMPAARALCRRLQMVGRRDFRSWGLSSSPSDWYGLDLKSSSSMGRETAGVVAVGFDRRPPLSGAAALALAAATAAAAASTRARLPPRGCPCDAASVRGSSRAADACSEACAGKVLVPTMPLRGGGL